MRTKNHNQKGNLIAVADINLWYQVFGTEQNEPLLLVNGGGPRACMWPELFCQNLADRGFFVVRYDHRGSGYSSHPDSPYDLKMLAEDANNLLASLNISSAHVLGASMGGWVAMLLASQYVQRVRTLIGVITGDINTFVKSTEDTSTILPKPTTEYINWLKKFKEVSKRNNLTFKEKVDLRLECWKICNGAEVRFDEEFFKSIIKDSLLSSEKHGMTLNKQLEAMHRSVDQRQVDSAMQNIRCPTLILQGLCDPIFSAEHGKYLAKNISNAKLECIEGMGHVISPYFYTTLADRIQNFIGDIGHAGPMAG